MDNWLHNGLSSG
uniref:Uncharacterized protein n=1 Tax=Arundo donax TaxID=35708 RepID=A0A0A9ADY5_ARUDO